MKTEFIPRNPEYQERIKAGLERQNFMKLLGVRLSSVNPGEVIAEVDQQDDLRQQNGFLHGGVAATLCDVSAGFAAFTLVAADEVVLTGDLMVSYLNPGKAERYRAEGRVIKAGKRLSFCEARVWGIDPGMPPVLIAKANATMVTVPANELTRP